MLQQRVSNSNLFCMYRFGTDPIFANSKLCLLHTVLYYTTVLQHSYSNMAKSKARAGAGAGRNASKQSKKFISSGALAATIKDRKRKQEVKRKIDNRRALRQRVTQPQASDDDDDDEQDEENVQGVVASASKQRAKGQSSSVGGAEEDSGDEMSVMDGAQQSINILMLMLMLMPYRLDDETLQALLGEDHDSEEDNDIDRDNDIDNDNDKIDDEDLEGEWE